MGQITLPKYRFVLIILITLMIGVAGTVSYMGYYLRQEVEDGKICFNIQGMDWHKCFYLIQEDQVSKEKEIIKIPKIIPKTRSPHKPTKAHRDKTTYSRKDKHKKPLIGEENEGTKRT